MEKQSEKTIQEQKADIIRKFTEALDKNTTTPHEVWCIIHALQDACEFMADKRYKYRSDLSMSIRYLRGKLNEGTEQMLYDDITDDISEIIMLSGANAEGLEVINKKPMEDALHEISDIYNC